MSVGDDRLQTQARGWARVARAAAMAHGPSKSSAASGELFDAIDYAAVDARMELADVVDAYLAGVPELDVVEAYEAVEEYLERIASVQSLELSIAFARVERALPDWRRRLELRIAAHDLALGAQRALGGQDELIEKTRAAVAEVLDGARAAHASEDELDAFIQRLRIQQCDIVSVVAAAAATAAERARLAARRGLTLPDRPWATSAEIAHDRGVPADVATKLVDRALNDGLLAAVADRGVAVTPTGSTYIVEQTRL